MNFRSLLIPLFVVGTVAAAQTPAAGTITTIPAAQRLDADGDSVLDTAVTGANQHPGFCGFFAKQSANADGQVNNLATALDLIDDLSPGSAPSRSASARELVPVADLVNGTTNGSHTPNVKMAWTTGCTSNGGELGGGVHYAYRWRGNLHVTTAGTKTFMVNSDDGYSLRIGGLTVMEFNGIRGTNGDTRRASFASPGVYPIEVIYWEQGGDSVMELLMADANVCFNGTTPVVGCATGSDRSNAAVLTGTSVANFTIMGSTQVAPATWSTVGDRCTSRINQPNTLCSAPAATACGNSVVEQVSGGGIEACDDGNTTAGDGCNATCGIEPGYVCSGATSVCVPSAPVINVPAIGASVPTTTPTFSGTGLAGATVTVRVDGVSVCTAVVAAGGTWSCASSALAQGAHSVAATQTDTGGRMSAASAARAFSVDTVAPASPVVTAPTSGQTLNTNSPTFSGTAEAGATVRVFVDGSGTASCTTTAGPGGAWSCAASPALTDGAHGVRTTATDAAGNISVLSTAVPFSTDTTAPAAPVVSSPTAGAQLASTTPSVSGTAEANSTVTVLVDGAPYCTATASPLGAYSCAGSTPLSQGTHSISARAADAVGNTSPASTPFNVNIDTVAPGTPSLIAPASGANLSTLSPTFSGTAEAGTTVRVFIDGSMTPACTALVSGGGSWSCAATLAAGSHTVQIQAVDLAGNASMPTAASPFTLDITAPAAPVIASPGNGAQVNTATPTVSGSAEPNASVAVYVDGSGTPSCTTTASASGTWSCVVSPALSQAAHSLVARAADAAGNVSVNSNTVGITVDTTPPTLPVIVAPAAAAVVGSTTPSISGTGEVGSTISVFIDGSGTAACTATVIAGGTWSCAVSPALSQGAHSATARAQDAAGNQSALTAARSFSVDTVPPTTPVISVPALNASVSSTTPTVSGTGEAGTSIAVFIDGSGMASCTTTVDAGGAWSCAVAPALGQGAHSAVARSTDAGGNIANSAARPFSVDTVAPAAPVITVPTAGALVNTTTPTVTGTGEVGATITVFADGGSTPVCTATVDAGGAWSCTVSPALTQGSHSLTSRATDAAGNASPLSTPVAFNIDSIAPAVPVISTPAASALITPTTPTITGTGEVGATISVFMDGSSTAACTATVIAAGTWSCTVSSAMSQGAHNATARQVDAAGNVSPTTPNRPFTIDSIPPAAPAITSPVAGSFTNDTTPTVTGTGEVGSIVSVFDNGGTTAICTATVAAGGTWTCTSTVALAPGEHTFITRAADAAGNNSTFSAGVVFTIDTTPPTTPAITAPVAGSFTNDTTPTVTGTGEAGSTVSVFDNGGSTALCTATVAAGGTWTCTPTTALTPGAHTLTSSAVDAAGNTSGTSPGIAFTIDTTPPTTPAITAPVAGSFTNDTTPTVTGTGEAGSTVSVFDNGGTTALCTATVAAGGTWTCTPSTALTPGAHTFTSRATDEAGNNSTVSPGIAFTIDTTPPTTPAITAPVAGSFTNDTTPTVTGTGEAGSTVSVFDNGGTTAICTATVAAGGTWTCTPTTALTPGAHTLTSSAVDAAGNNSTVSPGIAFTIDTTPPTTPAITAPVADATLGDNTPTFTGTGEAGSTVSVFDNGGTTAICTAVVTAGGTWSCTPATSLTDGAHVFTSSATDPAGNTSGTSTAINVTIDTAAPSAPVVTAPTEAAQLSDSTPAITGTGEVGATVSVFFDGSTTAACTAVVAADNSWSCSPPTALTDGAHTITTSQTDAGGNTSPLSTAINVTVDTAAPATPVITSPTAGELLAGTPTVTGTAEVGSTVTVFADGGTTPLCTVVVPASGAWSCSTTLTDGSHTLSVISTDPAGNASSPATVTFNVDSAAPNAPVILAPTEGGISATSTTFSGTAEAGSTVRVFIDGSTTEACTSLVSSSGTWACIANNLSVGAHTASATAQDETGNTSAASMTRNFSVAPDAPPGPPVIAAPADESFVNDATPTVSGQAALLSTVRVFVDGSTTPACTATTDASGHFTCDLSPALTEGAHSITATATVVGVVSMPSAPVDFTVDLTAPVAPVVSQPVANATTGSRPTISGTAEVGSTVSVYVDGNTTPACTATANTAGVWVCTPATALTDGAHTLEADATDAAGNVGPRSNNVAFTVDSTLPVSPPVITSPATQSVLSDATPTIEGNAAPFSTVDVFLDGATTPVCTTTAAADGTFSCTPATALTEGAHTLTATATDANGTSLPSSTINFSVDTIAPGTPVITAPVAGDEVSRAPTFSGTAEAGTEVEVRVDGQLVCTATASSTGAWSCTLSQALPPGAHTVNATAVDAAGNRSTPSADVAFTVVESPTKPVITSPTAGQEIFDTLPTVTGIAEPNSTITVTVDGMTYCTTTAATDGSFSCEGSGALALGSHSIVVTSTNAGGTETSDTITFTIDDTPPAPPVAPVITHPTAGSVTFDNTPEFSGTAEAGTTVTVRVDGVVVCTTTATSTGTFSCTGTTALGDGAHSVTATASRGGVDSEAATAVRFTVSTVPPTVTSPTPGSTTPRTPTVTGTATPGSTVVVTVNGEVVCTTTADENGNFSCPLTTPLTPGEATIVVEVRDTDGNVLRADPIAVRSVAGALNGGGVGCSSSPASASLWLAALVLGWLFTRRSRTAAVALAAVVVSGAAQAQTTVAPFELERVRLNPGAADGLLQEGGALLDPMSLRVSLFGHYQHNPLVVRENGQPVAALVGSRWTAHLGAAYGITDWLEAGLQVPVVLSQTGNAEGTGYTPVTNVVALGTPFLQVRAAPFRERSGAPLDLSVGLAVGFPLGSAEALTRDNTVTAIPTIGVGKKLGSLFRIGGNVSVAIRPASGLNDGSTTQVGSYMTTGLVLSTQGKVLRGELSGRIDIPFTASPAAGELYAGVRWAPHHLVELSLIGGPGFGTQPGTPAFRLLAGVAFTPNFGGEAPKEELVTVSCVGGEPHDPKACVDLDLDGDGVKNAVDRCPETMGVAQREGCPDIDSDGDGVLDLADKCPKVAGVREFDGCPEPDSDNDGVADARDACPNAAGPVASAGCPDTDGDGFDDSVDACVNEVGVAALKGCPDVDTDGDGVVDRLDNCVKEKGVAENQGCPAKQKQLVIITAEKLVILDKVYFASGKATVLPKSNVLLKQVARVLTEHPDVKLVIVEGHTDSAGKPEKNLTLSQSRAEAVRTKIISFGVAADRLQAKGFGDTRPIADNKTPKGREENRRVEFVLGL